MLPLCVDQGIGVLPWSPLARGFLAGNRTLEDATQGTTSRAACDLLALAVRIHIGGIEKIDSSLDRRTHDVFGVVLGDHPRLRRADGPRLADDDHLSAADVAELAARLARVDRLSRHGRWTAETLALIEHNPRTAASRLAPAAGRETRPFKADVRKLKKLGLTVSYEISARGRAFLVARKAGGR